VASEDVARNDFAANVLVLSLFKLLLNLYPIMRRIPTLRPSIGLPIVTIGFSVIRCCRQFMYSFDGILGIHMDGLFSLPYFFPNLMI
jgi:hypothetical protein